MRGRKRKKSPSVKLDDFVRYASLDLMKPYRKRIQSIQREAARLLDAIDILSQTVSLEVRLLKRTKSRLGVLYPSGRTRKRYGGRSRGQKSR